MTPEQRFDFSHWVINEQAKKYLGGFDKNREVFHLDCSKAFGLDEFGQDEPGTITTPEGRAFVKKVAKSRPVTVGEILECLSRHEHETFFYCIDTFFDDDPLYGDLPCKVVRAPGFQDGEIPDFWADPEPDYDPRVVSDEGLKELVSSVKPPPKWLWPILGIAAVVGGVIVLPSLLPSLCLLSNNPGHWSCPSSPLYPPGQTPQPGGDR